MVKNDRQNSVVANGVVPPPKTNLRATLQKIADKVSSMKLHPTTSEEYDTGYIGARTDAFAIVQEVIDVLPAEHEHGPLLSTAEQKAQATRCSCGGSDDYCPCQNVADTETRKARAALATTEGSDR